MADNKTPKDLNTTDIPSTTTLERLQKDTFLFLKDNQNDQVKRIIAVADLQVGLKDQNYPGRGLILQAHSAPKDISNKLYNESGVLTFSGDPVLTGADGSGVDSIKLTADGGTASGDTSISFDTSNREFSLKAGSNVTLTGDATNRAITIQAAGGGGSVAGSDTQVQYNNGGSFGGAADLTFNDSTGDVMIGASTGDDKLNFRDSAIYMYSVVDGVFIEGSDIAWQLTSPNSVIKATSQLVLSASNIKLSEPGTANLYFDGTQSHIKAPVLGLTSSDTTAHSLQMFSAGGVDVDASNGDIDLKANSGNFYAQGSGYAKLTSTRSSWPAAWIYSQQNAGGIHLEADNGGLIRSDGGSFQITGSDSEPSTIAIKTSDASGGLDIDCGTVTIDCTGVDGIGFSIDGVDTSNVTTNGTLTVSGSTGLNLHSDGGEIDITTRTAGADVDINAAGSIHLTSTEDVVNAISVTSEYIYFTGGDQDGAYQFYSKPLYLDIITTPATTLGKLWCSSGYILNWGGTGLTVTGSAHFNKTGADYDFQVETGNKTHAVFVDGGTDQVLILSGGADTSANESTYTDVNFFVSGTVDSKDSSAKGTSLFGGDLVVSGNLYASSSAGLARCGTRYAVNRKYHVSTLNGANIEFAGITNTSAQQFYFSTSVAKADPLLIDSSQVAGYKGGGQWCAPRKCVLSTIAMTGRTNGGTADKMVTHVFRTKIEDGANSIFEGMAYNTDVELIEIGSALLGPVTGTLTAAHSAATDPTFTSLTTIAGSSDNIILAGEPVSIGFSGLDDLSVIQTVFLDLTLEFTAI